MGHIRNYDIMLSAIVTVMVGFVVMLSDIFSRLIFFSRKRDSDSKADIIVMVIGAIFLVLSPIFGKLMQLAISRRREFLADATAIEFTRNPDGLISALQKLDSDQSELDVANDSTAHMYIVAPFKGEKKKKKNWFSTHPPIEDRIEALRNLK